MNIEKMSLDELEEAIIEKFGIGDKKAYVELPVQFIGLCEAHEDDPLVKEYRRKGKIELDEDENSEDSESDIPNESFLTKKMICK